MYSSSCSMARVSSLQCHVPMSMLCIASIDDAIHYLPPASCTSLIAGLHDAKKIAHPQQGSMLTGNKMFPKL